MVYRLCTFCVPKYKYDKYLWIQIDTNKYNKSCVFVLGNNPMVGMTVAVAVAIEEAAQEGRF